MNTAVINIKTQPETKIKAQTIAKELGMTESGKIIYLKEEGTMAMKK